jgi:hypothetical protein
MDELTNLIYAFVQDSFNPTPIMAVAKEYKRLKQYASAISFFLRAANYSENLDEQYEALINVAHCFTLLPDRVDTTRTVLYHCINLNDKRPEAYFLLSRSFEWTKKWHDAYVWASMGLKICDFDLPVINDVEYVAKYHLIFEKAISAWWCERQQESRELLLELTYVEGMDFKHTWAVSNNLRYNIGVTEKHNTYLNSMYDKLKYKFDGSDFIDRNYSEAFQDLFALTINRGKRGMHYLEVGGSEPIYCNNTYLLESKFGWTGISIDWDADKVKQWEGVRSEEIICANALDVDYTKILKNFSDDREYGYLQIDCEPSETSFKILISIPFEEFKFATITFEHDYCEDRKDTYRTLSRRYLKSLGYVLVCANVSMIGTFTPFEDWYVHPDLVDDTIVQRIKSLSEGTDARALFLE